MDILFKYKANYHYLSLSTIFFKLVVEVNKRSYYPVFFFFELYPTLSLRQNNRSWITNILIILIIAINKLHSFSITQYPGWKGIDIGFIACL